LAQGRVRVQEKEQRRVREKEQRRVRVQERVQEEEQEQLLLLVLVLAMVMRQERVTSFATSLHSLQLSPPPLPPLLFPPPAIEEHVIHGLSVSSQNSK